MSFALSIKEEILNQEFSSEQALAFVQGIIASSGVKDGSSTIIKINNANVSEVIRDMLGQMGINFSNEKENKNWIKVSGVEVSTEITQPAQYFAGAFVGGGSISDPSSTSYHLEIQMYSNIEASKIQTFLNKYSFEFTKIQRRKLWVLYIKKSEQISDFLRAIQTFNALLAFEDARINRDFQNQLNRYSNLDIYNQQKLADSSNEFKELYKEMVALNREDKFRDVEMDFFKLKLDNPYSSLAELTTLMEEKHGVNKTRAGLNHWIIKLRKVVAQV